MALVQLSVTGLPGDRTGALAVQTLVALADRIRVKGDPAAELILLPEGGELKEEHVTPVLGAFARIKRRRNLIDKVQEQLANPRKGLTAHVWCANAPAEAGELDGWLAAQISAAALARKPFTPLPLLGVPGWWAPNAGLSFYDDPLVFRPRRVPTSTTTPPAPADAPHP